MDMKQEIFMRLVVEQCDPHAMGWDFSDLYQLACDAEKFYREHESKVQADLSKIEAQMLEVEANLIRELKEDL